MALTKILLIFPRSCAADNVTLSPSVRFVSGKIGNAPPLGLATIAALTPPEFQVKIIDENIADIDFSEPCDIVGLSGYFTQLPRIREIALKYSSLGKTIVCGGPSASLSPERWRRFADILIIGEAERIWPKFLFDYENGSFQPEYIEKGEIDLSLTPLPAYEKFPPGHLRKYLYGIIQTNRGCPYNCEFCDSVRYLGHKPRYKSVNAIIRELDIVYSNSSTELIYLADDNIIANRNKAKEIFKGIGDWNSKNKRRAILTAQTSIDIADDEELLELAVFAGVSTLYIGLETPRNDSLRETGKIQNLNRDIFDSIRKIQQYGIIINSGCIVGFDNDDINIFREQYDFYSKTAVTNMQIFPLHALDKTPLKERVIFEGRYMDWEVAQSNDPLHTNFLNTLTIKPKKITVEQMNEGIVWLYKELFNPVHYADRFVKFLQDYRTIRGSGYLHYSAKNLSLKDLKITLKLLIIVIIKTTFLEKRAFLRMCMATLRSEHPHRFPFLVICSLRMLNTMEMIEEIFPDYRKVNYPV